ncbi:Rv3654c family TadE-like protein [Actinophytocola oryzae]|uniref:Rv3654c family TadE-like protein n=1 Tax=Actinophytocola oryzae TaxID=502181 RepID=UPI0024438E39|nr:Rv3654c family TadE-like protein [Actinophytocola oryzae]
MPLDRSPLVGCDERSSDRGSATVWAVGGLAIVLALLGGVLWLVAAVAVRHRAQGAADLAALAAAGQALAGERRACDAAREVTGQMGVELVSCRLVGWDALVEVAATPPDPIGRLGQAVARARAGPVEDAGSAVIHER